MYSICRLCTNIQFCTILEKVRLNFSSNQNVPKTAVLLVSTLIYTDSCGKHSQVLSSTVASQHGPGFGSTDQLGPFCVGVACLLSR